jgi:hypothetical protein
MSPLESEIAALDGLPAHDLRIAWRRLYRERPPRCLNRDLMIRAIAYRMQERAHGGLPPATRRRLRSLVGEIETKGTGAFDPGIALKPGARLAREWGGHMHTVVALENGFDYDGERYPSLTRIATLITGAHWSGPRFFGIRKTASRVAAARESRDE